jgi:hypothetical protein
MRAPEAMRTMAGLSQAEATYRLALCCVWDKGSSTIPYQHAHLGRAETAPSAYPCQRRLLCDESHSFASAPDALIGCMTSDDCTLMADR